MLRKRCFPTFLLFDGGFWKTKTFLDKKYVGDPINTCRIFEEFEVDEVCIYGIDAYHKGIDFDTIGALSSMLSVPLTYGGGIANLAQVKRLVNLGVERVSLGAAYFDDPNLADKVADIYGSQSVVITLDVIIEGGQVYLYDYRSRSIRSISLEKVRNDININSVGELIYNFVDQDGTRKGPNFLFADQLAKNSKFTQSVIGGVASESDILHLFKLGFDGVGVGSHFVYAHNNSSVVLHYPREELDLILEGM